MHSSYASERSHATESRVEGRRSSGRRFGDRFERDGRISCLTGQERYARLTGPGMRDWRVWPIGIGWHEARQVGEATSRARFFVGSPNSKVVQQDLQIV